MTRMKKYREKRKISYWANIAIVLTMLFIMTFCIVSTIVISKENDKIRKFILNYDKTKNVYNLQQDFLGGNY